MNQAELVRDGLLLAFVIAAPVAATVTAAAVIVGGALQRVGVRDAVASTVIRALAVVLALWMVGEVMARDVVTYAGELWAGALAGRP